MFDIEFVSGTGVQFELKKEMDRPDVQKLVEPFERQGLPSAQVVAVGSDRKTYEVVTPNPAAPEVKAAIMKALGDVINVEQPSSFANSAASFDEAINERAILPIISENEPVLREAGAKDEIVQRHSGGVAIVLRNLDPPLTAEQITKRLQSARLQPDRQKDPYRRIDVQVARPPAGESASRTAVILCSDENLAYTKVPEQWKPQLARPLWALVNEAISHPAELQKVVNFDAQVAGETLRDGIMALVVSILLIMVYIWFRFGNLLYAAATVVALLHDTLITVGAIGISHYLGNTVVGNALLVEPFRMNLTLLAAVLTVMGYSMNDTIVVFDRIRENRGKFGHVSRTIINDSINQTLSRTLLTGGTTLVTILFMYITGGPGIHGFTFALLVGILVGTYSSIAIASPILLLGRETTETRRTVAQVQPASR
jgi:SecD/SecF fusion protein